MEPSDTLQLQPDKRTSQRCERADFTVLIGGYVQTVLSF